MTQEHLPPARDEGSDPLPMLLATEHWSLLGTRSMTWAEVMSRITILLTVASAGLVVLALVAQSSGFTEPFWILAIGLNATVLLLGALTSIRVSLASQEDAQMVLGMNRIRAAYVRLAPEIEQYLTAATTDDAGGLLKTYTLGSPRWLWAHVLGSTSFFLQAINAVLAGVLGALITHQSGGSGTLTAVLGAAVGLAYLGANIAIGRAMFGAARVVPRFPSPPPD